MYHTYYTKDTPKPKIELFGGDWQKALPEDRRPDYIILRYTGLYYDILG